MIVTHLRLDLEQTNHMISVSKQALENPLLLARPGETLTQEQTNQLVSFGRDATKKMEMFRDELIQAISILETHVAMEKLNAETNTGSTATN